MTYKQLVGECTDITKATKEGRQTTASPAVQTLYAEAAAIYPEGRGAFLKRVKYVWDKIDA